VNTKLVASLFALAACGDEQLVPERLDDAVSASTATCTAATDLDADPLNCGVCGNVCASGLCYWGVCADDRAGHIFAIGASYRTSNPALDRVLGNAVFAREGVPKVLFYRGGAPADIHTGTAAALTRVGQVMRRSSYRTVVTNSVAVQVYLPQNDVFIVEAQPAADDAWLTALADEWSLPIDDFLRRGGIVVVTDAPSATNTGTVRVLGVEMPMSRTTVAPGAIAYVGAPGDLGATRVPLTFAVPDAVGYAPTGHTDVVTSESGDVVVAHRAFY
jgi:hypothetical protein